MYRHAYIDSQGSVHWSLAFSCLQKMLFRQRSLASSDQTPSPHFLQTLMTPTDTPPTTSACVVPPHPSPCTPPTFSACSPNAVRGSSLRRLLDQRQLSVSVVRTGSHRGSQSRARAENKKNTHCGQQGRCSLKGSNQQTLFQHAFTGCWGTTARPGYRLPKVSGNASGCNCGSES